MPWIQSLRFVGPLPQVQGKIKHHGTVADKYPRFFDEDMQKWKHKFEKHIHERNQYKKLVQTTQEFNMTTKNTNFMTATIKSP